MKKVFALLLLSAMLTVPALAGEGGECPMMKGGVASTLREAADALKASNPDLSARVAKIAEDCAKAGDKVAA